MKKFKKLLVAVLMMVFTFTLASCDKSCNLEYTDENGETTSLKVQATEDKEEVYEVVSALNSYAATKDEVTFKKIGVSVNVNAEMKAEGMDLKADAKAKLEISDAMKAYANVDASFKFVQSIADQSMTMEGSVDGDAYLDETGAYLDLDMSMKQNGVESSNSMKNMIPFEVISGMLEDMMGDMGSMDSAMPDIEIPDLSAKDEVLAFIETYGITISATSKSTITFKISAPVAELSEEAAEMFADSKIDVYFTLDINNMMPVSFEINADSLFADLKEAGQINSGKLTFKVNLTYGNGDVKTLTDAQKGEFTVLPM